MEASAIFAACVMVVLWFVAHWCQQFCLARGRLDRVLSIFRCRLSKRVFRQAFAYLKMLITLLRFQPPGAIRPNIT